MDEDIATVRALIGDLTLFAGVTAATVPIVRIGGMTNRVYRVGDGADALCMRLPGKGTAEYINRRIEAIAAEATAKAGVSPKVIHVDPASGVLVTRFIEGAVTMSPALFATSPGAPARAGRALRQLHQSGAVFDFRFELFAMIDSYLALLANKRVTFPTGYDEGLRDAETVRDALGRHPVPLAPCHCDPLAENFLDAGAHMWIVDWEYSGMNDPMWDLGDLSVEAGFDDARDTEMLRAYAGAPPSAFDRGRMVIYKAMCDLLWTLWGLIQLANGNPAEDFAAYAENRFRRCRNLMKTPEFHVLLEAVRRG
jgi:thiamine kinase-like enzyme